MINTTLALKTSTAPSCTSCTANVSASHVRLIAVACAVCGSKNCNSGSFHYKISCSSCRCFYCYLILSSCAERFPPKSTGLGHPFRCLRPVENHFVHADHRKMGIDLFQTALRLTGDERLCRYRLQQKLGHVLPVTWQLCKWAECTDGVQIF